VTTLSAKADDFCLAAAADAPAMASRATHAASSRVSARRLRPSSTIHAGTRVFYAADDLFGWRDAPYPPWNTLFVQGPVRVVPHGRGALDSYRGGAAIGGARASSVHTPFPCRLEPTGEWRFAMQHIAVRQGS
jgi:hypothetical protein